MGCWISRTHHIHQNVRGAYFRQILKIQNLEVRRNRSCDMREGWSNWRRFFGDVLKDKSTLERQAARLPARPTPAEGSVVAQRPRGGGPNDRRTPSQQLFSCLLPCRLRCISGYEIGCEEMYLLVVEKNKNARNYAMYIVDNSSK